MHINAGELKKEALNPLQWGLQVVVSCTIWVLGTELGSSTIAVCALNC